MNIFLIKNNERQGPYSLAQIVEMNRNGQCAVSDLAWHEGLNEWKPIHNIAEVIDAILPPVPDNFQQVQPLTSPPPVPTHLLAAQSAIDTSSGVEVSSQPEALALCLQSCRGILGSTVNLFMDGELKDGNFIFKDRDTLLTRPLLGFGKPRTIEFPISDVVNVKQTDATTLSFDLAKVGKIYKKRYVVNALNAQNASILINLLASTIGFECKSNRIKKCLVAAFFIWLIVHGLYLIYQAIRG